MRCVVSADTSSNGTNVEHTYRSIAITVDRVAKAFSLAHLTTISGTGSHN